MEENKILEAFRDDSNYSESAIYPTAEDFAFIKEAKADYEANDFSAEAHHKPEVLALTMVDRNKLIRRLVASILIG